MHIEEHLGLSPTSFQAPGNLAYSGMVMPSASAELTRADRLKAFRFTRGRRQQRQELLGFAG